MSGANYQMKAKIEQIVKDKTNALFSTIDEAHRLKVNQIELDLLNKDAEYKKLQAEMNKLEADQTKIEDDYRKARELNRKNEEEVRGKIDSVQTKMNSRKAKLEIAVKSDIAKIDQIASGMKVTYLSKLNDLREKIWLGNVDQEFQALVAEIPSAINLADNGLQQLLPKEEIQKIVHKQQAAEFEKGAHR